jgi:energy-coupling factor transport system ATP-binding protein
MPIELSRVSYTYAKGTCFETDALKDFSMKIEDGEYLGIMGHTGCGKSTLIQLMAGLISPSGGFVTLDGKDINGRGYVRDELHRKVGVVFQYPEYQLFESSVEKDVAFGLKHAGLSRQEVSARVQWALETVGFDFDRVRALSPLGFSGGEKRCIAIAGVLAAKPKILILDEPIAGLDPLGRRSFLALTRNLNAGGTTIVMISHNADALAENAGRIAVLEGGRLIMDGPAAKIFSDADGLHAKGIGVGSARETARLLKLRGQNIPDDIITYDALLPYLIAAAKGANGEPPSCRHVPAGQFRHPPHGCARKACRASDRRRRSRLHGYPDRLRRHDLVYGRFGSAFGHRFFGSVRFGQAAWLVFCLYPFDEHLFLRPGRRLVHFLDIQPVSGRVDAGAQCRPARAARFGFEQCYDGCDRAPLKSPKRSNA